MIWFTSDTHGYHVNITRGQTTWDDKEISCRDYETVEEMTDAVVNSINSYVKEDDILYHLGDWTFGGIDKIWEFRKRINCKTIHLIKGNHDDHIWKNKILPNCITNKTGNIYDKNPNCKYDLDYNSDTKAQDLFTTVNAYLEVKLEKKTFVLSHFPMQEWYEMDKVGSIMLHGHNHGRMNYHDLNKNYRRMDVGCDTNNLKPYSIDEIIEIMRTRKIKPHNS